MRYSIIFGLAAFLVHSSSKGQQQLPPTKVDTPYSQLPFQGIVPPHFQGNDLHEILDALSTQSIELEKDQYETNAQHEARLGSALTLPLTKTLPKDSLLAFVFPPDKGTSNALDQRLKTTYDAESGKMQVSIEITNTVLNDSTIDKGTLALPWSTEVTSSSHYVATNAFGAVFDVTKMSDSTDALLFRVNAKWGEIDTGFVLGTRPLFIEFSIDASRAKLLSTRIRALVTCVVNPYNSFSSGVASASATFDSPISLLSKFRYLHVSPAELWIFDTQTGEVLAKSKTAFPVIPEPSGPKLLEQPLPQLEINPVTIQQQNKSH